MRVRILQNLWHDGAVHCVGEVIDAAPECAERLLCLGLAGSIPEKVQERVPEKVQEKVPEKSQEKNQEKSRKKKK